MLMPAVTDDETSTEKKRVAGNFVGIIQQDDVLQLTAVCTVDQHTTGLVDKRDCPAEWSTACDYHTVQVFTH